MSFKIYNSLTNNYTNLSDAINKEIKWYSCGPTIYDDAHLGHARTYVTFDIIRRILLNYGHNIIYQMNITDIDDKIIKKVNDNNYDYYEFIKKKENDFFKDMDKLNVLNPTVITRVTEYIDKMKEYIQKIIDNGLAYQVNGSIYIDSQEMRNRNINLNHFHHNVEDDFSTSEYMLDKKNKTDFVLWKAAKPNEISFPSKWTIEGHTYYSEGRPGWHLECSVMATDILGESFDIHSGGFDLKLESPCRKNKKQGDLRCDSMKDNNGIHPVRIG